MNGFQFKSIVDDAYGVTIELEPGKPIVTRPAPHSPENSQIYRDVIEKVITEKWVSMGGEEISEHN